MSEQRDTVDRNRRPPRQASAIISTAIAGAATLLHSGQAVEAVALIAVGLLIVAVLYGR